jgi:hypothetical protein
VHKKTLACHRVTSPVEVDVSGPWIQILSTTAGYLTTHTMTLPPPSPSSSPLLTEKERRDKLTECLLSQYKFCAGGVVAGGAFSMARASTVRVGPWPLLAGGFLGTMGDFIYGCE